MRAKVTRIVSICHQRKLGLLDLAKALQHFGRSDDPGREYLVPDGFAACVNAIRWGRRSSGRSAYVVWDNSASSLVAALIGRLSGGTVVYYYHEPGGLGQKLLKSDPFFYSLAATFVEWIFRSVSHRRFVARHDKIRFGDVCCPLLYDDRRPRRNPSDQLVIGFLGRRDANRLSHYLQSMAEQFKQDGVEIVYFPSAQEGNSTEQKFVFLSKCSAVWNVYGVAYNQSGVTGDAVMSGTPVIHSAFEPYGSLLSDLHLGIEVDLAASPEQVRRRVVLELNRRASTDYSLTEGDLERRSLFGGRLAFLEFWKPAFDAM